MTASPVRGAGPQEPLDFWRACSCCRLHAAVAAVLRIPQARADGWEPHRRRRHRRRRLPHRRRPRRRRCPPGPCTSRSPAWTSCSSTAGARCTRCGRWSGRAGRPRARCGGGLGEGVQAALVVDCEPLCSRPASVPDTDCYLPPAGRQPLRQHRRWGPACLRHRRRGHRGARPAGAQQRRRRPCSPVYAAAAAAGSGGR